MHEPELSEQFEDLDKQAHAWRLGMWVFLGSEVFLFAALLALYGAYREMYANDFLEAAAHNDLVLGTVNTLVLITSSLTVAGSIWAMREGRNVFAARLLWTSIALGLVFLIIKGVEYSHHFHEGIFPGIAYRNLEMPAPGAKMFFTIYFLTTGLHALHVVGGIGALWFFASRCQRGIYTAQHHVPVELGGLYWHLVDVVWIFLWPLFYLSR